jgi:hypothetical protein
MESWRLGASEARGVMKDARGEWGSRRKYVGVYVLDETGKLSGGGDGCKSIRRIGNLTLSRLVEVRL